MMYDPGEKKMVCDDRWWWQIVNFKALLVELCILVDAKAFLLNDAYVTLLSAKKQNNNKKR